MSKTSSLNGKAFEYACLRAFQNQLNHFQKRNNLIEDRPYDTAKKNFSSLQTEEQAKYNMAAAAAAKAIFPLEPQLRYGKGLLELSINIDRAAQGIEGDVRDIMIIRCLNSDEKWEMGLSCKHNHEALKHPRITERDDFGSNWIGVPCSSDFQDQMKVVIQEITTYQKEGALWRDIDNKQEKFYLPIIKAYRNEILKMCTNDKKVAEKLLSYFFGSKDFYKVIMLEKEKITKIEAFNMHSSLGKKAGKIEPSVTIKKLTMPTKLNDAKLKSKTTILLQFDEEWSISMRLHNKDKEVKTTSLAWDVSLTNFPKSIYTDEFSWDK